MMLMSLINQLKSLIVPFVLILLFQGQNSGDSSGDIVFIAITLGIVAITVIYSVFKWFFYKYSLQDEALIVSSGVFIKKRRYIKPQRVQTTNLEAGILLRVAGLVSLKVETAGSKKEAEFILEALKKDEAKMIQQYLKGNADHNQSSELSEATLEKEPSTIETGLKDLFIAAITSGNVGVVFLFLITIASQFTEFVPERTLESVYGSLINQGLILIIIVAFLVLIVSWVVSIIRYVIRFALFKIEVDDDELTITRGLIVKRTFRLKKHRIQALNIVEGLLREPFGFATVECEVAGGSSYEPGYKVTLLPLVRKKALPGILETILPEYDATFDFEPLPQRALKRYIIRSLIPFLLVIPLYFIYTPALLILIVLPIAVYLGLLRFKNGGFEFNDDRLVLRSRLIAKRTVIAKRRSVQDITLTQNILQKRRKLLSVDMTVLSTPSHKTFRLKDLSSGNIRTFHEWMEKNMQNS